MTGRLSRCELTQFKHKREKKFRDRLQLGDAKD